MILKNNLLLHPLTPGSNPSAKRHARETERAGWRTGTTSRHRLFTRSSGECQPAALADGIRSQRTEPSSNQLRELSRGSSCPPSEVERANEDHLAGVI